MSKIALTTFLFIITATYALKVVKSLNPIQEESKLAGSSSSFPDLSMLAEEKNIDLQYVPLFRNGTRADFLLAKLASAEKERVKAEGEMAQADKKVLDVIEALVLEHGGAATALPTALPTTSPTTLPTATPTALPTASPTASPTALLPGNVVAWGHQVKWGIDNSAVKALPKLTDVVSVQCGNACVALTSKGAVEAWGSRNTGGDPQCKTTNRYILANCVAVKLDISSKVVSAQCGSHACVAVKKDGSAAVWGYKGYGADSSLVDVKLASKVKSAQCGYDTCVAVKSDRTAVTWGQNALPGNVVADVVSAQCGRACVAVRSNGSIVVWGKLYNGKDHAVLDAAVKDAVSSKVLSAQCGGRGCVAVKSDGSAWSWGVKDYGNSPDALDLRKSTLVVSAQCGSYACVAVKSDESAVVWGIYQAGNPSEEIKAKLASGVISAQCGHGACVAVKSDGSAVAWGSDSQGGDTRKVKDDIKSGSGVISAQCGMWACVAVKSDGSAVAWGRKDYGGTTKNEEKSIYVSSADVESDVFFAQCGDNRCVALKKNKK